MAAHDLAGPARHCCGVSGRLVMIGGGPSCVSVVLRLAALAEAAAAEPALAIVLVDRQGETGGGGPHARTVSPALLLNDSVSEIDSTGIGLTDWLLTHRERWLAPLRHDPDPRVAGWVRRHAPAVRDAAPALLASVSRDAAR